MGAKCLLFFFYFCNHLSHSKFGHQTPNEVAIWIRDPIITRKAVHKSKENDKQGKRRTDKKTIRQTGKFIENQTRQTSLHKLNRTDKKTIRKSA